MKQFQKTELHTFLEKFYRVTQVPMILYSGQSQTLAIPPAANPAAVYWPFLMKQSSSACYVIAYDSLLAGLIRCEGTDRSILVGPALLSPRAFLQAPILTEERFLQILHFLDYTVNASAAMRVRRIKKRPPDFPELAGIRPPLVNEHIDIIYEDLYTRMILKLMSSGNVLELQKSLHRLLNENLGPQLIPLSADRFIKNIFIGANSLACRAAISGGASSSAALALSDHFIAEVETCASYDAVLLLLTQMLIAYTKEASRSTLPKSASPLVRRIIRCIQDHLYESWTASDTAEALNMDLSYLCRHFKKETGETISTYIQKIKIQEGKRLMEFSDLSLAQISVQLGFSSQSYFHRVFKKLTGMTPGDYKASIS